MCRITLLQGKQVMKYLMISIATVMICGAVGLSTDVHEAHDKPPVVVEHDTKQNYEMSTHVEYIEFDPLYITVDVGKNEG